MHMSPGIPVDQGRSGGLDAHLKHAVSCGVDFNLTIVCRHAVSSAGVLVLKQLRCPLSLFLWYRCTCAGVHSGLRC